MSAIPPIRLPASLQRLRCLLQPAFGVYACLLAAFIALGVHLLYDSHQRETQQALSTADNLARVFAERFEGTLRRIDSDLRQFVEFLPADALDATAAPRYRQRFENQFGLTLALFPEIASRIVVNAHGDPVYRRGTPSPVNNFSDRAWFITLRDNPQLPMVISDVITARATGKPTIVVARAIRDGNGRFLGTANATLNLDVVHQSVVSLNLGPQGMLFLRRTDSNRLVLRSPPAPEKINTFTSGSIVAMVAGGKHSGRFTSTSPIDGVDRAMAFHVLEDYPFYIAVGLAAADYLAEWRQTALYSGLAALALLLALSAFVVARIRSEARLAVLARQLRAGRAELRASEQFLRDVADSVYDGILVEDTQGRVRAFNRNFQRLWQIPPHALAASTCSAFLPHMASQLVNPQTLPLNTAPAASGEVVRLRAIELKDGRRVETFVSQLVQDGAPAGRVWSFHDVTERKRTVRYYRSIIESSADAFVAFDDALRITAWSPRAEALFGLRENEVLGRTLQETILPAAADSSGPVRRALAALQSVSVEAPRPVQRVSARRADGCEFSAEIQISGFRLGEHWQFTSFLRDITLRLREEEQVMQAQKFEAIGHLTGGLAHDFNNLLGIISGSLDLIGERFDGDRELLDAAVSAARRGAEVTRSLLAVARQQKLSPRSVRLDALLQELAPLLRHTAGKGVEVEVRTDTGDLIVDLDPGGLNNALLNLVINARDAMPDGGRLTISAGRVCGSADAAHDPPDSVRICVADNGCGMPPEIAARAFDPFFTTKPRGKGTGLGLAMVYGFARQSGGTVALHSRPGAGTTVELVLPVRAAPAPAGVVLALPAPPAAAGSGERVLLVDDEADLLRVTRQWLVALGYTVVAETDAARAARLLETEAFDALVSDVVMPGGMDGVALADAARRQRPDIAVVLVSGYADEHAGRDLSRYPLLDKPFGKSQLQQMLRSALDRARAGTAPRRAA